MLKTYWLQSTHLYSQLFRYFLVLILAISVWLSMFIQESYAVSNVQVSLPDFKVTLNGQKIENSYRKYPLIVYKNITYFPMTYDDSRFLGIQSNWTKTDGLIITPYNGEAPFKEEKVNAKNNKSYQAQLVTGKITVNGKSIDNRKEEYPLLVFRNVTYVPLSWKFAASEFKWSYNYSNQNGLIIDKANKTGATTQPDSPTTTVGTVPTVAYKQTSEEKVLTVLTVPTIYGSQTILKGTAVIAGNNLYFQGKKGVIYQTPVANPSQMKAVYQLPINASSPSGYEMADLKNVHGKAILYYQILNNTRGTDFQIWLKDDGSLENLSMFPQGYFENIDGTRIGFDLTQPPSPGNLKIQTSGSETVESLGEASYYYGWYFGKNNNLIGNSSSIELLDDSVYVLARKGGEISKLHTVNINTGKTEKIADADVREFKIDGNWIYFTSGEQKLYRMDLEGETTQMLNITGGVISNFYAQQGYVAYWLTDTKGTIIAFRVLNPNGKVVFETGENVYNVQIKDGNIQYAVRGNL